MTITNYTLLEIPLHVGFDVGINEGRDSNSTPVTEELTIKQRRPEVKWQTKISNPDNLIIQEVELQSGRQLTKKANLS